MQTLVQWLSFTRIRGIVLNIAVALAFAGFASASAQPYRVETIASGLEHPWSLAWLPDGRMLVTERPGRLRVIKEGRLAPQPVSGVPTPHVRAQAGLFEVLPAPDFEETAELFLSMAYGTSRRNSLRIFRATLVNGALEDVAEVFRSSHMQATSVHYGGRMSFLPDNTLIITIGDGFDHREEAQNLASHWGTVVRIDRHGDAPSDNPFAEVEGALREVFSYGHRNIQGLVVDREGGRLWAAEHGPRGGDELNQIEPGINFGWPAVSHGLDYSGARITPYRTMPGMRDPFRVWTPAIAPSGMAVYDGGLFRDWRGDVLIGGLVSRGVHRLRVEDGQIVEEELLLGELDRRIRDVRIGPEGAIYVLTDHSDGELLRIVPAE